MESPWQMDQSTTNKHLLVTCSSQAEELGPHTAHTPKASPGQDKVDKGDHLKYSLCSRGSQEHN